MHLPEQVTKAEQSAAVGWGRGVAGGGRSPNAFTLSFTMGCRSARPRSLLTKHSFHSCRVGGPEGLGGPQGSCQRQVLGKSNPRGTRKPSSEGLLGCRDLGETGK